MLAQEVPPATGVTTPDPWSTTPLCDQLEVVFGVVDAEKTAIRDASGATVGYGELAGLCREFAARGAGAAPVGVLGGSARALAVAVALVYAGTPLVLLDPQLPVARLRHILATSGATATIVDAELRKLADEAGAVGVLATADAWESGVPGVREVRRPDGARPATLVYTSGSTGAPKGVVLSHAAVVNGAATSRQEFGLEPGDVCAMLLPPAYAAGQEVLFMAVLNGCLVESFDPRQRSIGEIAGWLTDRGITTLHCTPSMLRHLNGSLSLERFPAIRLLTTCGEPIHGRDVAAARGYLPHADYANYVGSSETGHLSFFRVGSGDPLPAGQIPAGRVALNKTITPVADDGRPLPTGDVGVLEVSSPFLASGYWGEPQRTAEAFTERRSNLTVPADQWEALVSAVWCDVLRLETVGRDESFAELGGDSLAVEEMLAALGDDGIDLRGSDLAAAPTLAAFAARVKESAGQHPSLDRLGGVMVTLREGDGVPVYCFSGAGGPAYLFADLARKLDASHPVHAFQVRGLERRAIPDWSVRRAARRYAALVERQQPPGRVVLIGHSLGGLFALETAHLLRERGYDVALTVLLDTLLPGRLVRLGGGEAPEIRIPGGHRQSARELWLTRLQLLGAGLYPYPPAVRDQVFFQHGLRLTEWYRVRPWDGPTEVFLTPENLDDRAWWRHVLTGERRLHEVECGHVAILKPPYVNRIAALVGDALGARVG